MKDSSTFRRLFSAAVIVSLCAGAVSLAQGWVPANLSGEFVIAIASDPSAPSHVCAGHLGSPTNFLRAAISCTPDRGATWRSFDDGFGAAGIRALVFDLRSPTTAYAGSTSGLFHSMDGGATWQPRAAVSVRSLAGDPATSGTLYRGTAFDGVFKSTDGGLTWAPASNGMGSQRVNAIVVHPLDPRIVYAGTTAGVYRSADGAANWTRVLEVSVTSIVLDPGNLSVLYVGGFDRVWSSRDSGATWNSAAVPPLGGNINALVIHPSAPTTIYAATSSAGVWRSVNSGASWASLSSGLPDVTVESLEISLGTAPALWAGTESGIYRHELQVGSCADPATTLCLQGGRFRVKVTWVDERNGASGEGQARPLESDTGAFWFFSPNNLELVIKVLDGRAFNGKFWVFYGALSDVRYEITVEDTLRGISRKYANSTGNLASVADTSAFDP